MSRRNYPYRRRYAFGDFLRENAGTVGGVLGAGIGTAIAPGIGTGIGAQLGSQLGGLAEEEEDLAPSAQDLYLQQERARIADAQANIPRYTFQMGGDIGSIPIEPIEPIGSLPAQVTMQRDLPNRRTINPINPTTAQLQRQELQSMYTPYGSPPPQPTAMSKGFVISNPQARDVRSIRRGQERFGPYNPITKGTLIRKLFKEGAFPKDITLSQALGKSPEELSEVLESWSGNVTPSGFRRFNVQSDPKTGQLQPGELFEYYREQELPSGEVKIQRRQQRRMGGRIGTTYPNGGFHEENVYGGIPIGDALLEEDEYRFDDPVGGSYIFSNRF